MTTIGLRADRISRAINGTYSPDLPRELVDRRRVDKVCEEAGEAVQALGGFWGENPRKGQTHTRSAVVNELLDVAFCALAAVAHMTDHCQDVGILLDEHSRWVQDRLLSALGETE